MGRRHTGMRMPCIFGGWLIVWTSVLFTKTVQKKEENEDRHVSFRCFLGSQVEMAMKQLNILV